MAKRRYKTFKSIGDATSFLAEVMKRPVAERTVTGYKFPEKMPVKCRDVTFVDCVLRKASFVGLDRRRTYVGKLIRCDLSGSNMQNPLFGKKYMYLEDCVLDGIYNWSMHPCEKREMGRKQLKAFPMRCPREGAYTAYKVCQVTVEEAKRRDLPSTRAIVKLEIPADAKRVSYGGNRPDVKCRASKARVLSIRSVERSAKTHRTVAFKEAFSKFDNSFVYRVGEVVRPTHRFSESLLEECASGIHHFMTRREAVDYSL